MTPHTKRCNSKLAGLFCILPSYLLLTCHYTPHPWYGSWCCNSSPTHSPQRTLNTFLINDRSDSLEMCYATHFFLKNSERRFDAPLGYSDPGSTPRTPTLLSECLYTYHGRPSFLLDCTNEPQLENIQINPIDLGHTAHVLSQVFNLQNTSYTDGPTIPPAKTISVRMPPNRPLL